MTNKTFLKQNQLEAQNTNRIKVEENKIIKSTLIKNFNNNNNHINNDLKKESNKILKQSNVNENANNISKLIIGKNNTTNLQNKTLKKLQNNLSEIPRSEIPPSHKYFIPKHKNLSQHEKEKFLHNHNNRNFREQKNENQSIYFYKKIMDLDRKYSPEVRLHEENEDYPHHCFKGESSFKQYPYRSLDNQIKTKNFLEKEFLINNNSQIDENHYNLINAENDINNNDRNLNYAIGNKKIKYNNNKNNNRDFNNEITFEQQAENDKETRKKWKHEISNNYNINLPFENANEININSSEYTKLNGLLNSKNKKLGLSLINLSKKNFNNLSKYSYDMLSNQFQMNPLVNENKNEIFDSENILLNNNNKKFLENKDVLAFNEHYVNYMLKKNLKNNFKKIIKISNFENINKTKSNPRRIGINSNNSNMFNMNLNKCKDRKIIENNYSVKNSYLNDQLNVTPKNVIPLEIRYLIEKKIISGDDFEI